MAKKRRSAGMSNRIKTRHKKISASRKYEVAAVNAGIRDINKVITEQVNKNPQPIPDPNN